jgi:hypothetical protein
MIYFLALLPATVLTIAGYFVLYLSSRSEGGLRTFGRYLGFWAFTLAALLILGAVFAAAHARHDHCPMFCPMHGMHEPMQGGWGREHEGWPPGAGPQATPAAPPGSSPPPTPPAPATPSH